MYRKPEFLSWSPFVWRHLTAFSYVSLTLHSSVTFRSHSTSLPVHIQDPLSCLLSSHFRYVVRLASPDSLRMWLHVDYYDWWRLFCTNKTFFFLTGGAECCTWLLMKDWKQLGVPPPGLVSPTSCTFLMSIQASLRSQHQIPIQSFLCFFCLKNERSHVKQSDILPLSTVTVMCLQPAGGLVPIFFLKFAKKRKKGSWYVKDFFSWLRPKDDLLSWLFDTHLLLWLADVLLHVMTWKPGNQQQPWPELGVRHVTTSSTNVFPFPNLHFYSFLTKLKKKHLKQA